jgi:hypothetical protein
MREIELGTGISATIDDEDFEILSKYSWSLSNKGYAYRTDAGKGRHIFMHRDLIPCKDYPEEEIDHINRNKLDNRKSNLRICTKSQNLMNKPAQSNNTSGYKGVSKKKDRNKWQSQISVDGRLNYIGSFNTAEEAAEAYDRVAKIVYGNFAVTNF